MKLCDAPLQIGVGVEGALGDVVLRFGERILSQNVAVAEHRERRLAQRELGKRERVDCVLDCGFDFVGVQEKEGVLRLETIDEDLISKLALLSRGPENATTT